MIKFDEVTKKFPDGTVALADISLEIADKEFIFLVGPSGAGKTTFFKLIIKDFIPDAGNIFVDELDVVKAKEKQIVALRRSIGFVFQDLKLLNNRNVFENVALPLEVLGWKNVAIKEAVESALKKVGLGNHHDQFPAQLSGGELQRVAIARSIVGNPKYLFADEPTGNIDPANTWSVIKLLDKINADGTTVIVATHDTEVVNSLKKRVIKLDGGRIIGDKKGKYH